MHAPHVGLQGPTSRPKRCSGKGSKLEKGRRPEGAPTPPPGGPLAESQTPAFLGAPALSSAGP